MTEEHKAKKEKHSISKPIKVLIFLTFSLLYSLVGSMSFFWGSSGDNGIFAVSVAALFLLMVFEFVITKFTDMSPVVLMLSILPFALFSLLAGLVSFDTYFFEMHGYSLYILAARALFGTIDCIRARKRVLAVFMPVIFLALVIFHPFADEMYTNVYDRYILEHKGGQSDITGNSGSWGAINYFSPEKDNWTKLVEKSEFPLTVIDEGEQEDGTRYINYEMGAYPVLDGSTVCVPLAVEFARQHLDFGIERAKKFSNFSTTHYAYENLINGVVYGSFLDWDYDTNTNFDYKQGKTNLFLGTEPSAEELQLAQSKGVTLVKEPICYDAFVFITHRDNPVNSLTVEQIRDIYSGKITNWKEVGGKDEKIRAFQREANSGSQTAMENLVMGTRDMIDPIMVKVIEGMGELVDAVAEYENETASLGYTYRYYIDNLYKNEKIKTIAVEGIAPTDENIRSEKYPFSTNYYGVYIKEDASGKGKAFLEWILSDEGQACVKQAGYISINA